MAPTLNALSSSRSLSRLVSSLYTLDPLYLLNSSCSTSFLPSIQLYSIVFRLLLFYSNQVQSRTFSMSLSHPSTPSLFSPLFLFIVPGVVLYGLVPGSSVLQRYLRLILPSFPPLFKIALHCSVLLMLRTKRSLLPLFRHRLSNAGGAKQQALGVWYSPRFFES